MFETRRPNQRVSAVSDLSASFCSLRLSGEQRKKNMAVGAIIALALITAYSAFGINHYIASNANPIVEFVLGTTYRNVLYANSQTMDIYITNTTGSDALPVVIYVHGGGLTAGDKSDINTSLLNAFASSGFIVASINYRLAPQHRFPAQIEDVKSAIRYLRANAQEYHINASEIFAYGDSSGGTLVSLAALTSSNSVFDTGPYLNQSSRIEAGIDLFGESNFTELISPSDPAVHGICGNETNLVLASPTHFVSKNASPLLIIQGVDDTNVPESQSIQLYNDLKDSGAQTKLILVQNAGHEFVQVGNQPISPSREQITQDMVSYFEQHA